TPHRSYTLRLPRLVFPFSFYHPSTTAIYTLSLHDALPISRYGYALLLTSRKLAGNVLLAVAQSYGSQRSARSLAPFLLGHFAIEDRKSTRLNSSHVKISYAVFCLKKKTIFIIHKSSENDRH